MYYSVFILKTFPFAAVRFPNQASSIGFTSKGPTSGLLSVADIPEGKPGAAATEEEAEQNEESSEVITDGETCQTIELLKRLMMVHSSGNEDKNASLELFMKTSNPTLILMTGTLFFFS